MRVSFSTFSEASHVTPTLEVEVDLVVVDEDLQEESVATTIDELGDSLIKLHVPTSHDTTTFFLVLF